MCQFPALDMDLNGFQFCDNCEAILDVGTSLIVVPEQVLDTINQILGVVNPTASNGVFLVDCSSIGDLPDIVFTIARRKFPLKSGDYVLRYGNTCVSGFTSMNGNSLLILGEIFLGAYYTTYDIVYKLIGLAPAIH